MARSREHAQSLIASGSVTVGGLVVTKAASQVDESVSIAMAASDDYVSRGAHKLVGALDAFDIDPTGLRCLDAGASTGGFTDVLLQRGARHVVCVDVGYGQLAWKISQDPRVTVMDRTNVRNLTSDQVGGPADLIVADLSFISLETVLPALVGVLDHDGVMLLMVKPQFEVGKDLLGAGGVVTEPTLRADAVWKVATSAFQQGLSTLGVVASPLPGPAGNVEYFLWLARGNRPPSRQDVDQAVQEGPS